MEWQHLQNQLFGRFGLAIGWNKKNSPRNLCSHVIFIVFFNYLIEIAGGDVFVAVQNKKVTIFLLVAVCNEAHRQSIRGACTRRGGEGVSRKSSLVT